MSGEVALRKAVREDIGKVWKMQTEAFRELLEKYGMTSSDIVKAAETLI